MSNTMQWVKATTRLPEKSGNYFIKQDNGNKSVGYFKEGRGFKNNLNHVLLAPQVEWLDESSGAGMAEALEEIAKGQQGELKGDFIARVTKLAKAALETDK